MSSSCVRSSLSRQGYGSQARVSSFNLYFRHWIHFNSPFNSPSSIRGVCDSDSKSPCDATKKSVPEDESVRKIPSPWLMLPPAFGGNNMTYKFYSLAENEVLSFTKTKDGDPKEIIYKHFRIQHGWPRSKYEPETEDKPDHDAYLVGSSHGWLTFFNRSDWNMFLTDPVSRRNIKLPPLDTLPKRACPFRFIKNVVLSCSPGDDECRAMMIYGQQNRLAFCRPERDPEWTPIGRVFEYLKSDDTRILRAYQSVAYSSKQKLFFSVTELLQFEAWDLSDPRSPRRISMVDDVQVEDGKSKLAVKAAYGEKDEKEVDIFDHQILVVAEHSDELFMVTQFVMYRMGADGSPVERTYYGPTRGYCKDDVPYKTIGFDVHKYDPVARAFKYINTCTGGGGVHEYDPEIKAIKYSTSGGGSSLDGLALFVGLNHGFALRADEYPGLKPNSIYFTDRHHARQWCTEDDDVGIVERDFGGHDVGIFNHQDGTFSPCYFPCDYESIQRIRPAPMWFTPNPPL